MSGTDTIIPQRASEGIRVALGVGGLIAIVLGIFIMVYPVTTGAVTMQVLAVVVAIYALVVGLVYVGTSLFGSARSGWARTGHILLGALYVVGGLIVLFNIGAAATVLAMFLSIIVGMLWLFEGIMSFSMAKQSVNKVWTIIYGVISVVAGLVLLLSPLIAAVTLWWLLGISMAAIGLVQVVRAFQYRSK